MIPAPTRLGWGDGLNVLCTAAAVKLYYAHLSGTAPAVAASVRGMALAAVILIVAGRSAAPSGFLGLGRGERAGNALALAASAGFAATVVTGEPVALACLMAALAVWWAATTVRHLIGGARAAPGSKKPRHSG